MGFLSSLFGERDPIGELSLDDLKITEIQLTKKVDDLHAEVRRIDTDVQKQYDAAKAAKSQSEEVSYARRIKTLLLKKEGKLASQSQIEKQLRAVSNLLILKEREHDIPSNVLAKLKRINPETLEKFLVSAQLDAKDADAQVDDIIKLTTGTIETGVEAEEDLTDILDTIHASKDSENVPGASDREGKRKYLE